MKQRNKICGLSMIEFLLALTISLFILNILSVVYLAAQKNLRDELAISHIQENQRIAFELLRKDIKMAGYIGCAKLTADFPLKNYLSYDLNIKNNIVATGRELTVRHAEIIHDNLTQTMRSNSIFYANSKMHFSSGDILLISDCKTAEIVEVKNSILTNKQQKITTTAALAKKYEKNAEVSKLMMNTYFVEKTERLSKQGKPIFALYVADIFHHKMELVEDVESLSIQLNKKASKVVGVAFEVNFSAESGESKTSYGYISL